MNIEILRQIGLTENEVKIYLTLLKTGSYTAYELSQATNIYRAHVYDKLEQLMNKGLVTQVYKGARKHFQATPPEKITHYLEEKKRELEDQAKEVEKILPELESYSTMSKEDTRVEVFKGKEGLKYFLKDIIKEKKEVLITGIDDRKYEEALSVFMKQYFRDLKKYNIKERIITIKKQKIFTFSKKTAPTTKYKYLYEDQFNPTNTFVYGEKVVIVTWGALVTAILIENKDVAQTYKNHFEHLWKIASETN